MKKLTFTLILIAVAFSTNAEDAIKFGSPAAATKVASDFLVLMYQAPKEQMILKTPMINGAWATINGSIPNKKCALKLQRHDTANSYGWVVQEFKCD